MNSHIKNILVVLGLNLTLTTGCADTLYPITTGSHSQLTQNDPANPKRAVVWGNHTAMVNVIMEWLQRRKVTVVERARIQEVLNEQKIRLTHTPDDQADLLRVGRLIGADWIIFAEATVNSAISSGAYVNAYGGASRSETVYHTSVAVRSVNVENGEVRWSGTAHYGGAINNPEAGIVYLTRAAIGRATCPIEEGYKWSDESGCTKNE